MRPTAPNDHCLVYLYLNLSHNNRIDLIAVPENRLTVWWSFLSPAPPLSLYDTSTTSILSGTRNPHWWTPYISAFFPSGWYLVTTQRSFSIKSTITTHLSPTDTLDKRWGYAISYYQCRVMENLWNLSPLPSLVSLATLDIKQNDRTPYHKSHGKSHSQSR